MKQVLLKIKRKKSVARLEIKVGDPLHESFYDKDGTLKSSLYIRKETMGHRSLRDFRYV